MSINSELTRLDAVRDALVSSVNSKGGSLAADATLWQVKAAVDGIEVGSGEDPTPIVTQPAPSVTLNKTTGVITAAYTPVAGKVTDTSEKSATLQLTTQGAQTITPGTADKTIPADRYITGVQTVKGDANLTAGNIKKGVSVFGVAGSYEGEGGGGGGGGGAFDLVKVTEYTPYQAPFSGVSKVTFSGFGYDEMSGMDFSEFNGDWIVENPDEPDPLKRIFKRNDRYLYYFPDPEGYNGGDAWCINSNKQNGGYNAELYYNSTTELTNGTINWSSMMGGATTQCTVTKASYPEVQLVLKGQKATAYDPASKVWAFAEAVSSFTGAEKTVGKLGVYASTGTVLIGNKIATAAGPVPSGAIFYAPLESSQSKAETGQTLQNDGSVTFTGEYMSVNGSGKITFNAGSSASTGTSPASMSIWYKGNDVTGGDGLCLLSYGSTPSGNTALTIKMISGVPYATGWGGGAAQVSSNINIADSQWHHIAITYTNNTGKIYIDGELKGSGACSVNIGSDRSGAIGGAFWGNYSMCKGDFRAARIYNKVLSDEEIMALAGEF